MKSHCIQGQHKGLSLHELSTAKVKTVQVTDQILFFEAAGVMYVCCKFGAMAS
jgi:hypothetical protein